MASSDAGTSSGSDYQVFLSFRGPDTRNGFTDVLYHSLTNAGIHVFRDNEEVRVGERIEGSLLQGINNSTIYIPVFSRTYASSQWCLRELAHIMANISKSKDNKKVFPIFFDVDPNDVKLKTSLYQDDILNLECEKKLSTEQVNVWRDALVKVDEFKGWEVKKYEGHGKLIDLVVEEVVKKLKTKHRLVTQNLVGIDDQVMAVIRLLEVNSGGVRFIQIYGMGGIGKTTLAKVVFNELCSKFGKCCCFLGDVGSKSSTDVDLIKLQKRLLSEIGHPAGTRSIDEIDYGMKRIEEVLRKSKVLLVLDDVDNIEQVEKLVGKSTLYSGSRILITTRNKDVLQNHRLKEAQMLPYEMELMSSEHALQLFNKHAFDRDSPSHKYNDLSKEILSTTGRLPLALEVIGSLLYRKEEREWKKTLEELRKAPHDSVIKKLRISYDALSFKQKQIFLDIACFFIGEDTVNAIYMWEDCELLRNDGVDVLQSRCLIKIVENKFWMHDQLRDLGREIVCDENPINLGERSRLRIHKDNLDPITTKEMKEKVQTLDIDLRKSNLKDIKSEEIRRFKNLRCLKLNGGTFIGNLTNCLIKLRWIFWSHPPPASKPPNMHLKNVVVLQISYNYFMDDSMLQSLIEMATKLKVLSLEGCPSITRTPNFSKCLKLERLRFFMCENLRKIDGSIRKLNCLTILDIDGCSNLEDVPKKIDGLVKLEHFCIKFGTVIKFPDSIWKLNALREVYFSSEHLINIEFDPTKFWELPSSIGMLQKLEVLHIMKNFYLTGPLPSEIGNLSCLRILKLSSVGVSEIPKTIGMLPQLQILVLIRCDSIRKLPVLPASLTNLELSFVSLKVVPYLSNLTNLVVLDLDNGRELCVGELWGLGRLSKLTNLSLKLHNVPSPSEMASLHLPKELYSSEQDQQTFPQLPLSLQRLHLSNFNLVVPIFPNLRDLLFLEFIDCLIQEFQLDGLQLPHLKELIVRQCQVLERFKLSNMRKLTRFVVRGCLALMEIQYACPFESLELLSIIYSESFERLVYVEEAGHDNNESVKRMVTCEGRLILPSRALKKLQRFELQYCYKISEIHVVGTSESWKDFTVRGCPLLHSICGLPDLKNLLDLSIDDCEGLQVVEGLDLLEGLKRLTVWDCRSLERSIDMSITELPDDCHIDIRRRNKSSGFEKKYEAMEKIFVGSVQSYKHRKEEEQESDSEDDFEEESDPEQEEEQESDSEDDSEEESDPELEEEQESDPEDDSEEESDPKQELKPRRRLGRVSFRQESHLKQDQELKSHFKQEQELKPTRMRGAESFQCPSFNSFLHCILPCFFPLD